MSENSERVSIIVVSRDRFSPTTKCLEELIAHTDARHPLIAVLGGAPKKIENELKARFAGKVRFIFHPEFLNPAQVRNIGLRAADTRLSVLMDNDVNVRPGWLEPLVKCQMETNAAMVVPIILEGNRKIHTAGNDLFICKKNGKTYGRKELRFLHMFVDGETNLKRQPTDYGELHCQLVETDTALKLGAYDENIQEVGEVDAGLTWQKANRAMYFEPASVVVYDIPKRITRAEDIWFFAWRWDMHTILKGYRYFEKKWNMDISDQGTFQDFLVLVNSKLGLWPRLFPCQAALVIDRLFVFLGDLLQKPRRGWLKLKAKWWGYDEWVKEYKR